MNNNWEWLPKLIDDLVLEILLIEANYSGEQFDKEELRLKEIYEKTFQDNVNRLCIESQHLHRFAGEPLYACTYCGLNTKQLAAQTSVKELGEGNATN